MNVNRVYNFLIKKASMTLQQVIDMIRPYYKDSKWLHVKLVLQQAQDIKEQPLSDLLKTIIYLHDAEKKRIGNAGHELAGAKLAEKLLKDKYPSKSIKLIAQAIRLHCPDYRGSIKNFKHSSPLALLLALADDSNNLRRDPDLMAMISVKFQKLNPDIYDTLQKAYDRHVYFFGPQHAHPDSQLSTYKDRWKLYSKLGVKNIDNYPILKYKILWDLINKDSPIPDIDALTKPLLKSAANMGSKPVNKQVAKPAAQAKPVKPKWEVNKRYPAYVYSQFELPKKAESDSSPYTPQQIRQSYEAILNNKKSAFLNAIMLKESMFNPYATNNGAYGLTQIRQSALDQLKKVYPDKYGATTLLDFLGDPELSIQAMNDYIADLSKRYGLTNPVVLYGMYYAGLGAYAKAKKQQGFNKAKWATTYGPVKKFKLIYDRLMGKTGKNYKLPYNQDLFTFKKQKLNKNDTLSSWWARTRLPGMSWLDFLRLFTARNPGVDINRILPNVDYTLPIYQ